MATAPSGSTTFTDIVGANADILTPTILYIDHGRQYRVILTVLGSDGLLLPTYSNIALVQVTPFTVTIAGTSTAGFTDGALNISQFNNPTGVLLIL